MTARMKGRVKFNKFRELAARDGDQCHYCEILLDDENRTIDHVVPASENGGNGSDNLVLACEPCNNARGNMPYEAYVALPLEERLEAGKQYNKDYNRKFNQDRLTFRPFKELSFNDAMFPIGEPPSSTFMRICRDDKR